MGGSAQERAIGLGRYLEALQPLARVLERWAGRGPCGTGRGPPAADRARDGIRSPQTQAAPGVQPSAVVGGLQVVLVAGEAALPMGRQLVRIRIGGWA